MSVRDKTPNKVLVSMCDELHNKIKAYAKQEMRSQSRMAYLIMNIGMKEFEKKLERANLNQKPILSDLLK